MIVSTVEQTGLCSWKGFVCVVCVCGVFPKAMIKHGCPRRETTDRTEVKRTQGKWVFKNGFLYKTVGVW